MRLREMLHITETELPKVALRSSDANLPNGSAGRNVTNLDIIRASVYNLSHVPPLREAATRVFQLNFNTHLQDKIWMPGGEFTELSHAIGILTTLGTTLAVCLRGVVVRQGENVISIQIPHPKKLGDLADYLGLLKIGIEHPVSLVMGESLAFDTFDVGTDWIDLIAASTAGVEFILGVWWAVLRLEKERADLKRRQEEAKSLELDNTHTAIIDGMFAKLAEKAENAVIREVLGKSAPAKAGEPEVTAKLLAALGALEELRAKGARVVPSLNAKPEIRDMGEKIQGVPDLLPAPPKPPELPPHTPELTKE